MTSPAASCPSCGATLPDDAVFCARCGVRLAAPVTEISRTEMAGTVFDPAPPELRSPVPPPPEAVRELPPMRFVPGTMVGVYRIESVLGEGGMGVVYRAFDTAASRAVALKCLHTNLAGDVEIRRRFVREAKIMRAFSHPGAVGIFDFVEYDHLLALVMELVPGTSLARHLLRWRGQMPFPEIRQVFGDVLLAMDDAHKSGVVHRDLKPDNILVYPDGARLRTKIVDFGIAKILEGTTYTMSGALLGTCRYMSPEQVRTPHATDPRSDIYSLGVTLYELVTGRPPFDGSHFSVMMSHVNDPPPPPSLLRPDTPPDLEALVLDALSKDRGGRPASCATFRERLLAALPSRESVPAATEVLPPFPSSIREPSGREMILVPAGTFQMGQNRREVHLDAFYMDKVPVTNEDFKVFLDVTKYAPTDEGRARFLAHWRRGRIPRGEEKHPVVYVSWFDARAYAAWAGKRLPTEAEWEKAARGVDGRKFPWGRADPTATHASFGRRHEGTLPVGSFPEGASPYGILDLAGNVFEWCEDEEDAEFYENGPSHNPRSRHRGGPDPVYVVRGGSWMYGARALRTYARSGFDAHYRFAGGGFRCAAFPP